LYPQFPTRASFTLLSLAPDWPESCKTAAKTGLIRLLAQVLEVTVAIKPKLGLMFYED
jgi:hypothetical protein